eukprot:scaffold1008_cov124-Cylindrotheca_fusiformis.AAC.7
MKTVVVVVGQERYGTISNVWTTMNKSTSNSGSSYFKRRLLQEHNDDRRCNALFASLPKFWQ